VHEAVDEHRRLGRVGSVAVPGYDSSRPRAAAQ
jgi:hypothetical protein